MKIVEPRIMADIDARAIQDYHIPGMVLMENAGIKGFRRFLDLEPGAECGNLLFVAGGGNNAGDALVMARQAFLTLPRAKVRVLLVRNKTNELAGMHLDADRALGIPVTVWEEDREKAAEELQWAEFLFDGVAGTGLKGALRSPLDELVESFNRYGREKTTVAVDVPSGVGSGFREGMPAVEADYTLTMGLPKTTLYTLYARPKCGRIENISLGFPPELLRKPSESGDLYEEVEPLELSEEAYKGARGHCAVFAGNVGTTGAAALSSAAASRAGAGLVTFYCDEALYSSFAGKTEGVMTKPLARVDKVDFERHSAIVAGPGWGESRAELLNTLLESGLPGVADADALRAAAELTGGAISRRQENRAGQIWNGRWVLTPHPGEFRLLSDIEKEDLFADPVSAVKETAARLDAVVLLKAHVVYIASADGRYGVVDGMNSAMGTGGSGDVLSGTIGGLLAAGLEPFEAAVRGATAHQAAGRRADKEYGWFSAEQLLPFISSILRHGAKSQR